MTAAQLTHERAYLASEVASFREDLTRIQKHIAEREARIVKIEAQLAAPPPASSEA